MSIFKKKKNDREKFERAVELLREDPEIRKMEDFAQHRGNNTLRHAENVADISFRIANRLGVDIDETALARGAMLHDFYLYTTRGMEMSSYRHGVSHPETALKNAARRHLLTDREANIIRSHMWPLTLFHPPKCKEAAIVCLADKYCAVNEMLLKRHHLSRL